MNYLKVITFVVVTLIKYALHALSKKIINPEFV